MLRARWARLMLVGGHADGAPKEQLLAELEAQAQQLYRRPYLARGTAERTLLLLTSLFQVAS
jgi:hypothetical protein